MTNPTLSFPPSNGPRTWLITAAASPIGLRTARALLRHGDNVVLGALASDIVNFPTGVLASNGKVDNKAKQKVETSDHDQEGTRAEVFAHFVSKEVLENEWQERTRVVGLDSRVGQCQSAIATAVTDFGSIDVLFCCASEAAIGTVEELGASSRTKALVREQYETNFFGPINIIKAALPAMRAQKNGHIIVLTGITSHLGTPGLGLYCASGWAIEGFVDSLAYEVGPFNIKVTIVQPNYEIQVLSNKISAAPNLAQYTPSEHPAPLARGMIGSLVDRIEGINNPRYAEREASTSSIRRPSTASMTTTTTEDDETRKRSHVSLSSSKEVSVVHPLLPQQMLDSLVAETVYAVAAIGGHDNPSARHIVGHEGVASVKEKLKTVSEELEDFVESSAAVDIEPEGGVGRS